MERNKVTEEVNTQSKNVLDKMSREELIVELEFQAELINRLSGINAQLSTTMIAKDMRIERLEAMLKGNSAETG